MARHYKLRPSQIINIDNDYEAFCFDEACSCILNELDKKDAKKPTFDIQTTNDNNDDLIEYFKSNNG